MFLARLLPLARTFVSLPAGARRVPLLPFTALTALGCAIWAAAFVLIGLVSGTAWSAVSSIVGKAVLAAVGAAIAIRTVTLCTTDAGRIDMSDEKHPGWPSRTADAAGARWGEKHPEDDPEHVPPVRRARGRGGRPQSPFGQRRGGIVALA